MYPWSWAEGPSRAAFSPRSSSTSSQEADSLEGEPSGVLRVDHNKRGRPRAEKISSLILEGALSANSIRCRICSRVFPREKSLQAHMRTHTGKIIEIIMICISRMYRPTCTLIIYSGGWHCSN